MKLLKKLSLILNALAYLSIQISGLNVYANDAVKLPSGYLLDSVVFYNQYKDRDGKKLSVEGYFGRYGSTLDNDLKKTILEKIVSDGSEFIIWSLPSTLSDAEVFRKKLEVTGIKTTIIVIPAEYQDRILAKAKAQEQGFLSNIWWKSKAGFSRVIHPLDTAQKGYTILKDQIIKPDQNEIYAGKLVGSTLLAVGAGTLALQAASNAGVSLGFLSIGLDPTFIIGLTTLRVFFGGTLSTFSSSISNFIRADLLNDFSTASIIRQRAARVGVISMGVSEAFYGVGHTIGGSSYSWTQEQLIANTATTGFAEATATQERMRRLSPSASSKIATMTFFALLPLTTMTSLGLTGGAIFDYGIVEITGVQAGALAAYVGLYGMYRYQYEKLERIAREGIRNIIKRKYERLAVFKAYNEKKNKRLAQTGYMCQSLFN